MPVSFDQLADSSEVWVTDDWRTADHGVLDGHLALTALAWANLFRHHFRPDQLGPWLDGIARELEIGGGAFRVTDEFIRWQEGLSG